MTAALGVIGTGEIAAAVVAGLCTCEEPPDKVLVSPRSTDVAAALAERFAAVEVADSTQAVVEGCDRVIVALPGGPAPGVLAALDFREGQPVVSLMPPVGEEWLPGAVAPGHLEAHVLILPSAEHHTGPIAIHPPSAGLEDLFGPLGTTIAVERREHMLTLFALSAWGAPVYTALATASEWAARQGVDEAAARSYVVATLQSLAGHAARDGAPGPRRLAEQAQSPGGLNEQVMERLVGAGWFEQVEGALDDVRARLIRSPAG